MILLQIQYLLGTADPVATIAQSNLSNESVWFNPAGIVLVIVLSLLLLLLLYFGRILWGILQMDFDLRPGPEFKV